MPKCSSRSATCTQGGHTTSCTVARELLQGHALAYVTRPARTGLRTIERQRTIREWLRSTTIHNTCIASLEQMPNTVMAASERLGIGTVDVARLPDQIGFRGVEQQIRVIRHQTGGLKNLDFRSTTTMASRARSARSPSLSRLQQILVRWRSCTIPEPTP